MDRLIRLMIKSLNCLKLFHYVSFKPSSNRTPNETQRAPAARVSTLQPSANRDVFPRIVLVQKLSLLRVLSFSQPLRYSRRLSQD